MKIETEPTKKHQNLFVLKLKISWTSSLNYRSCALHQNLEKTQQETPRFNRTSVAVICRSEIKLSCLKPLTAADHRNLTNLLCLHDDQIDSNSHLFKLQQISVLRSYSLYFRSSDSLPEWINRHTPNQTPHACQTPIMPHPHLYHRKAPAFRRKTAPVNRFLATDWRLVV